MAEGREINFLLDTSAFWSALQSNPSSPPDSTTMIEVSRKHMACCWFTHSFSPMETEKSSSSHVPDSAREPYSSGTRSHVPVGDIYGPGQDIILPLVETEISSRV